MKIFILAEEAAAASYLAGGARALAKELAAGQADAAAEVAEAKVALIALNEAVAAVAADTVFTLTLPPGAMLEDAAQTLAALLRKEQPAALLVQPSRQLRLLAGKIAGLLGTTALSDISAFAADGFIQHLVYGGAALRCERATTPTQIIFAPGGVLPEQQPSGAATVVPLEYSAPACAPRLLSSKSREKSSVDLTAAKRVIGVGRGIAAKDDMHVIAELAGAMEAEIGCTRPIAEEEKWLPREVYIGVSGLILAPEVYLAIGLSGQVQHTVGISRSKTIFAINKDKNAPIFKQADFGIVADLYQLVPALSKALEG